MSSKLVGGLANKVKSSLTTAAGQQHHNQDDLSVQVGRISSRSTHVNLTKEKERLSFYYDDIASEPINSLRFKHTYLAKHRTSQEYRCIKVLSKRTLPNNFFWSEVENYKTLVHPNVLHLYETFEDSNSYYFVTDRLDRPNLYQAIPMLFKKASDFDEVQVALVIRCMLKTLMYCHQKGIVHSSLTYEYILLDPTKGLRSLYIAGFGTARLNREYRNYQHRVIQSERSNSSASNISKSGRSASSISYYYSSDSGDDDNYDEEEEEEHYEGVQPCDLFAAPETRMGDLSVFEKPSDLWSTGVIAYQLLTRRNPFEDKDIWPINYNNPKWKADHFTNCPYLSHLSNQAKDFLSKLMCYEPEDRPTAEQALQHSWFNIADHAGKRVKKQALHNCLTNLQNFHANSKLEQATRMYIVNNLLQAEERAQLDACFRHLDRTRNNVITRDELRLALKRARPKDKVVRIETMLEAIFDRIDVQNTGEIEYSEFLAAAADDSVVLTRENLWATFNAFDKSHTGTITVEDLKRLFNEGREKKVLRTKDAKRLIARVDPNGDGEISFDEFCDFMHAD